MNASGSGIQTRLPKGDLKAHEFIRGMKGHFPTQPQAPSENRSKTLVF